MILDYLIQRHEDCPGHVPRHPILRNHQLIDNQFPVIWDQEYVSLNVLSLCHVVSKRNIHENQINKFHLPDHINDNDDARTQQAFLTSCPCPYQANLHYYHK